MAALSVERMELHHTIDGVVAAGLDEQASRALGMQLLLAHLVCMGLFLTVILTIPAWLFAAANIMRSPNRVYNRIEATARTLRLSKLYSRTSLALPDVVAEWSMGPGLLGMGKPDPERIVDWDRITEVRWSSDALVFELEDEVIEVPMGLARQEDIVELGRELRAVWQRATAAASPEALEEAERLRNQVAGLVQQRG